MLKKYIPMYLFKLSEIVNFFLNSTELFDVFLNLG